MTDADRVELEHPRPKVHKPTCRCVVCRRRPLPTMTTEELQALFAGGVSPQGDPDVDRDIAPPLPAAATNKGGGKVK